MQTFGATLENDAISHPTTDWHGTFVQILGDTLPQPTGETVPSSPETQDAIDGLVLHSRLLFSDAHNAGFYINSYTTKLNPGMDTVLQRLLEGVRRLHADWEASQAQGGEPAAVARGESGASGDQSARNIALRHLLSSSVLKAWRESGVLDARRPHVLHEAPLLARV